MRRGLFALSRPGDSCIASGIRQSAPIVDALVAEFHKLSEKRSMRERQRVPYLSVKRQQLASRDISAEKSALLTYCIRKMRQIRRQDRSKKVPMSLEVHFLLHFLPKLMAEGKSLSADTHTESRGGALAPKRGLHEAQRYFQDALASLGAAPYLRQVAALRAARLDCVSAFVGQNLRDMMQQRGALADMLPRDAIASMNDRLAASKLLMHPLWFSFWSGETLGAHGLSCILSYVYSEIFQVLHADARAPEAVGPVPRSSEPYSVLPTHAEVFAPEVLPFAGSAIAQRHIFSPSRVTHLHLCEHLQLPVQSARDALMAEFYAKYHAAFLHQRRASARDTAPKYGQRIRIPNVWRLMLQCYHDGCSPRPLLVLNFLNSCAQIERTARARERACAATCPRRTAFEAFQRSLALQISSSKREQPASDETSEHVILSYARRLDLLITAAKDIFVLDAKQLQQPSSAGVALNPRMLDALFSAVLASFPLSDLSRGVSAARVHSVFTSLLVQRKPSDTLRQPRQAQAASIEATSDRETSALWLTWKASVCALQRCLSSQSCVVPKAPKAHRVQWPRLSVVLSALRASPIAAFCSLCVHVFIEKSVPGAKPAQILSAVAIRQQFVFIKLHFAHVAAHLYYVALCTALFAVKERAVVLVGTDTEMANKATKRAAAQVDRCIRERGVPVCPHRQSKVFQRSSLAIPFLASAVPASVAVLLSHGYWTSALQILSTVQRAHGRTLHSLQLDNPEKMTFKFAQVFRGMAARCCLGSGAPAVWKKATALLHVPRIKYDGQIRTVKLLDAQSYLKSYGDTYDLALRKLCKARSFDAAGALVWRASALVLEHLAADLLHALARHFLLIAKSWEKALRTAHALHRHLRLRHKGLREEKGSAEHGVPWQDCLRCLQTMGWRDHVCVYLKGM